MIAAHFQGMLANSLTPITLISGVGLIMLCMTNRYNHSTDRIRQLIKKREDLGLAGEPDIDREIRLIFKRANLLRRSLLCLSLSAACSGLLVGLNVFSHFSETSFAMVNSLLLIAALLLIVLSTAFFSMEIGVSLHALGMAVKHLPSKQSSKR